MKAEWQDWLKHAKTRDPLDEVRLLNYADWVEVLTAALARPPEEARGDVEHLQMQIGYIVGQLQIAGDPRSLPEIVEEAAKATSRAPQEQEGK